MSDVDKMKCPACGAEMNHHADKVDYGAAPEPAAEAAEVVFEAHTCPDCGRSATRTARAES
jgi:ribosomal protein S27AE